MIKDKVDFKIIIFYYLPAFSWMSLIFYLSSVPGLKTGVDSLAWEIVFRKIAHLGEYSVLAFLLWRIFKDVWRMKTFKAGVSVFIFCLFFASTDEIHQFFVEDRAGKVIDVFIDGFGILFGIFLGNFLLKIKKRK